MRKTRKSIRQTVAENQAHIAGMCRLMGKPTPEKKVLFEPIKPRTKTTPSRNIPESVILKSIMEYLRYEPKVAWRMRCNSGTFMDGDRYISSTSQRGLSDIVGMLKGGRCFCIEVKSKTGKVMEHQTEFLELIKSGGGLAGIARSIDDVKVILFG